MMTRGMAVWMQAWSNPALVGDCHARALSDTPSSRIEQRMSGSVLPERVQSELVRVLAAMAWAVGRG